MRDDAERILAAMGNAKVTATDVAIKTGLDRRVCTSRLLRLRDKGHVVVVDTVRRRGQIAHVYAKHDDGGIERELCHVSNDWVRTS